jgi:hypothetical protein
MHFALARAHVAQALVSDVGKLDVVEPLEDIASYKWNYAFKQLKIFTKRFFGTESALKQIASRDLRRYGHRCSYSEVKSYQSAD